VFPRWLWHRRHRVANGTEWSIRCISERGHEWDSLSVSDVWRYRSE